MIKILLADNQALTASGLIHFFAGRDDLKVVDLVKSTDEFSVLLKKHNPDILIVDYNREGYIGRKNLQRLKHFSPETRLLIISSDNNTERILDILKLNVGGFLTKECSFDEVIMAIQTIARGEKFFCQKVLNIILERSINFETISKPTKLTARELELLKLLAKGYSTQKASDLMDISPHTVHSHRKKLTKKLSIKSPTEYVLHAIELGLIAPSQH